MPESTQDLPTGLYYIHDPMCSWCWGLRPVWQQLQQDLRAELATDLDIYYVLGGLAADTDQLMPESMQLTIQQAWKTIQSEIPGIMFNFDFWKNNQPRRATYPACRALIACRMQNPQLEQAMLLAIQQAYYLQAKNPSDDAVLLEISSKVGLDVGQFKENLNSAECQRLLQQQLDLAKRLEVSRFPSLVLIYNASNTLININYTNSEAIVSSILTSMHVAS